MSGAARRRWSRGALAALVLALLGLSAGAPRPAEPAPAGHAQAAPDASCRACHAGIEEMHPWLPLGCVECHGGDGGKTTKEEAHVLPRLGWPADERVLETTYEPAALRFRNPSDLRVVSNTCGQCHAKDVENLLRSLHGTTAGHLGDGLYENGVVKERTSRFGVFAVSDAREADQRGEHALAGLQDIERLRVPREAKTLADHFTDLPRKACMQCHLWSEGVGMQGRLGQDGQYRGAGCAACHVSYAHDGRSSSDDASADRFTPGHPLRHQLVASPPAETCLSCHVGDASIGNGFRGLAQLYPQMPAGPDIPGTTDALIAGQFFLQDATLLPPDLHHAAGMDCVDCHTVRDVMGDGQIYGAMEHAVEIECSSCHGTIAERSDLRTSRGRTIPNLERRGELFVLNRKGDGQALRVKQAADVVDPEHPDYNPRAAAAMTPEHAGLECYACHAGWNTNFFGFHFDRNLAFTQLDLITGHRTKGRVSTQERVFATLRQFVLGINPEGDVAPYMVGFSSMGTVHGEDGSLLLDQALPVTATGQSGMTMVHHQTHTTQRVARGCVECHRSPSAWGLGTGAGSRSSFALARGYVFVAGEFGLDTLLLDRENPEQSLYLARLPLGGARRVLVDSDAASGEAGTAFVVIENAGVALVDVRNPALPAVRSFAAAGDARDVALAGELLLIANGLGGLRIVDVADRAAPKLVADLVSVEAQGLSVLWPRVLIADGAGGLVIADISVPARPRITGQVRLSPQGDEVEGDARAVAGLFVPGRPDGPAARTPAAALAVVANGRFGLAVVDVTEPEAARLVSPISRYGQNADVIDVLVESRFELGDTTGLTPTRELDVAHALLAQRDGGAGAVLLLDLSEPARPALLGNVGFGRNGDLAPVGGLALLRSFNPPQLVTRLAVAGEGGLGLVDASRAGEPVRLARIAGVPGARHADAEAFAFDRMIDETGRQLKDISHEGARYFTPAEVFRVLTVPGDVLGTLVDGGARRADVTSVFGEAAVEGGAHASSFRLRGLDDEQAADRALRLAGGFRLGPREDLARLVRGAWPPDHDRNRDLTLSRAELEELVFTVLDANRDGRLDALEWPRHPAEDPSALDRNRDGLVTRAEMDLDEDVMRHFDTNGDGLAGFAEWPYLIGTDPLPSLYYAELAGLRKLLKNVNFARQRPGLYAALAGELAAHDVPDERLQQLLDRARARPISDAAGAPASPRFIERWDLDGDHAVDAAEYPAFARIAPRCDRNSDGRIDARDRP